MIDPPLDQHEVLYRNPNPEIEKLHVQAFNYDLGNGVKQDRVKANKLYLQAANAGDPRSMMNYAINRFDGMGVSRDPVDAYAWIDKARFATQHSKDMKVKWGVRAVQEDFKKRMTAEEWQRANAKR